MDTNNTLDYATARSLIRDGDILFFKGRGFVSSAIMAQTGGHFSHVEIAQWNLGQLMTMGATSHGTIYRRLSSIVGEYCAIAVARVPFGPSEGWPAAQVKRETLRVTLRQALAHLGRPYDFADIAKIWWRDRLGLGHARGDRKSDQDKFICSEFVAAAFVAAGIDLVPQKPDRLTTPEDVLRSRDLEIMFSFAPPTGEAPDAA